MKTARDIQDQLNIVELSLSHKEKFLSFAGVIIKGMLSPMKTV